jgi:hypothetical protein
MADMRIIDADKLLGKLDMNYDWELSEFEAFQKASHPLDKYGVFYFYQLNRENTQR